MDWVVRATLGPLPLPYVFIIVLLPLWMLFPNSEYSLLQSLIVVITILLKGSLFCHWSTCRSASWKCWLLSLAPLLFLEIRVIHEALHIHWMALVILVPSSCGTGVLIFRLHLSQEGAESSNVIGIFSRCSPEEYLWLSEGLRNSGKVRPFCISNSNQRELPKRVSECSVAILYHSKNRGRVNITDVTDSLYDEEVTLMSQGLGRNKVLVVVDDLNDSSDEVRRNILNNQPTIGQKCAGLFIFTTQEKSNTMRMTEKLKPLAEAVSRGSVRFSITDVIAILLLAAPWIYYLYDVYQVISLVLSNISGTLLLCLLLPSRPGASRDWLVLLLLLLVGFGEFVAFWNNSGLRAGWLASQALSTVVFASYCALSSPSSGTA